MDVEALSLEIDEHFGFASNWTFKPGEGCWQLSGAINIDEAEIAGIISRAGVHASHGDLVTRFIAGHEKGHHLQEIIWPHRIYALEHHVMEIEADLFGAWSLALMNTAISEGTVLTAVKQFDDANNIAKKLGIALGGPSGRSPHHPWAEQREMALVKGPLLALSYPSISDHSTRAAFSREVQQSARRTQFGL